MQVTIYKATRNHMQSVNHNKAAWLLDYNCSNHDRYIEPLMGRTSSKNMMHEVQIKFDSLEEAVRFAQKNNHSYEIIEPKKHKLIKKNYANNFK